MDKDAKIQLLLDMQEHPEQFSEQALQTMLNDPEMRELMEATAQLKQAMINEQSNENNVDAEWQRFAQTHLTEQKQERSWLKIAATFIGILMMSGIAFAAIHIIRHVSNAGVESHPPIQETTNANPHQLPADTLKIDTIPSKVVRYDEATLEQILTDMSDYYGLTLNWKSEEAKTLRLFYIWNKQQSAEEAITSMNSFERISLELNDNILTADIQTCSPKQ
ncbi:MAG: hypothetical protein IJ929_03450 [Prevotella sp.]|nr:hypothetical protein [Prevotella sp.]